MKVKRGWEIRVYTKAGRSTLLDGDSKPYPNEPTSAELRRAIRIVERVDHEHAMLAYMRYLNSP